MYSEQSGKEFGKFVRTAGKFFNDEEADKGELLDSSFLCLLTSILTCHMCERFDLDP